MKYLGLVFVVMITVFTHTLGKAQSQGIGYINNPGWYDISYSDPYGSNTGGHNKVTDSVVRPINGTTWIAADSFSTYALYTISMTCASTVLNPCSVIVEAYYTTDSIVWHKAGGIGMGISGILTTQTSTQQLSIPNLPPNATVKINTTATGTGSGATYLYGFDTH